MLLLLSQLGADGYLGRSVCVLDVTKVVYTGRDVRLRLGRLRALFLGADVRTMRYLLCYKSYHLLPTAVTAWYSRCLLIIVSALQTGARRVVS